MNHKSAILLALILFVGITVHAQQPRACITNKNAPSISTWHWRAGQRVKVFLKRGIFTSAEQETIREVIAQWNNSSEQLGTGIAYELAGETERAEDGDGYLTLTRIEIKKGTNNKYYAYFFPNNNADGTIRSAVITFDFQTTDLAALRSYVAHEMAHGMGLWDCQSCKGKSTIMNNFPNINKGNGLTAPSACDLEVVKAIFDQERNVTQFSNH